MHSKLTSLTITSLNSSQSRRVHTYIQECDIFLQGCRPLKTRDERQQDEDAAIEKLTGGAEGSSGILSWTFGQQGQDLPADAQAGFIVLLRHLNEKGIISDGAAAVERGGRMFHLHLQCMLWCPKLGGTREKVQEGAAELVYTCAGMPRGKKFHCYVELHWPGTQPYVFWRTMVGCALHRSLL
jgi:hypothetical protein